MHNEKEREKLLQTNLIRPRLTETLPPAEELSNPDPAFSRRNPEREILAIDNKITKLSGEREQWFTFSMKQAACWCCICVILSCLYMGIIFFVWGIVALHHRRVDSGFFLAAFLVSGGF